MFFALLAFSSFAQSPIPDEVKALEGLGRTAIEQIDLPKPILLDRPANVLGKQTFDVGFYLGQILPISREDKDPPLPHGTMILRIEQGIGEPMALKSIQFRNPHDDIKTVKVILVDKKGNTLQAAAEFRPVADKKRDGRTFGRWAPNTIGQLKADLPQGALITYGPMNKDIQNAIDGLARKKTVERLFDALKNIKQENSSGDSKQTSDEKKKEVDDQTFPSESQSGARKAN